MVVKQTCNYCHNIVINWMGEIIWWTKKLFNVILSFPSTISPLFRPAITHLWISECKDSECFLEPFMSTNYNFFTPFSEGNSIFLFFLTVNLQPFTLLCPVTGLSIKNLAPSFLDIHSVFQRCSPPAVLGLLRITETGSLTSSLYESNEAPVESDSHCTGFIWPQCKLSTCFSSVLTWLFLRVSKVQKWVKLVSCAQAPDYSCLSCCSPPNARLTKWL